MNWRVDETTLHEALGRMHGLAGVDALVIDLNNEEIVDWARLLRIAIEDFESVPVIALVENDRSLRHQQSEGYRRY